MLSTCLVMKAKEHRHGVWVRKCYFLIFRKFIRFNLYSSKTRNVDSYSLACRRNKIGVHSRKRCTVSRAGCNKERPFVLQGALRLVCLECALYGKCPQNNQHHAQTKLRLRRFLYYNRKTRENVYDLILKDPTKKCVNLST